MPRYQSILVKVQLAARHVFTVTWRVLVASIIISSKAYVLLEGRIGAYHAISTEDGAGTDNHLLEEFLVKLEDTLYSVYSDVHGEQDRDHEQHGNPHAQKAL